jgi:hypothetical protein
MLSRKGLCRGRKDFYPHVAKLIPVPVPARVTWSLVRVQSGPPRKFFRVFNLFLMF